MTEEIAEIIMKTTKEAIIFAISSVSTVVYHSAILWDVSGKGKRTETMSPICPILPTVMFETSNASTKRIKKAYPAANPHSILTMRRVQYICFIIVWASKKHAIN